MDGEPKLFCNQCGKELEYNSQFCRHCGAIVSGTPADDRRKEEFRKMEDMANEGRINLITFLIAIYAIPILIFGIWAVCNMGHVSDTMLHNQSFIQFMKDNNISEQMVRDAVLVASWTGLASGICATVSMVLCYLRRYWLIAVVCCFAAAILCFWSIFGAIIGIFVGWMLLSAKVSFDVPREFKKPF